MSLGAQGSPGPSPAKARRPKPPDEVYFPVVPLLDVTFQLLAFFVLTFKPPTRDTRLELYLPSAPAALSVGKAQQAQSTVKSADALDPEVETDLTVTAEADEEGRLTRLRLGEAPVEGPSGLEQALRQYVSLLDGEPLRVRLLADDRLRYEAAAQIMGACSLAGVRSIRLPEPQGPTQ